MEVNLIACTNVLDNTKISANFNKEEALSFGAKMAGVCYLSKPFNELMNEPNERTQKRMNQTLMSGHHSVYDHYKLTFEFSNIPKIIAMILNNEKDYSTSEKSARYTKFKELSEPSKTLYFKWKEKLRYIIAQKYPCLYDNTKEGEKAYLKIDKLAQENARYFVSIFEPTTTMAYTVSLRQLNYIVYMMKNYINNCTNNTDNTNFENSQMARFNKLLIPYLKDFISHFDEYIVPNLIPKGKNRALSLFGNIKYIDMPDVFSYVYQTSFKASFACEAQNQRHRSESTFIYIPNDFEFYVPEILEGCDISEWIEDSNLMKNMFPQGQLISIVQCGNLDTLILKARERICGQAQLEIMRHQYDIVQKFIQNSEYGDILKDYTNNKSAKCLFKNTFCNSPCIWNKDQFKRKI